MDRKEKLGYLIAGACAGAVNGLFGAGGGMLLLPLLSLLTKPREDQLFPASIAIILPVCVTSLFFTRVPEGFTWSVALPYLIGSGLGGIAAGIWGKKIPTAWLHRALGILILWGGIRYLW